MYSRRLHIQSCWSVRTPLVECNEKGRNNAIPCVLLRRLRQRRIKWGLRNFNTLKIAILSSLNRFFLLQFRENASLRLQTIYDKRQQFTLVPFVLAQSMALAARNCEFLLSESAAYIRRKTRRSSPVGTNEIEQYLWKLVWNSHVDHINCEKRKEKQIESLKSHHRQLQCGKMAQQKYNKIKDRPTVNVRKHIAPQIEIILKNFRKKERNNKRS